jgi:hypothetical protein
MYLVLSADSHDSALLFYKVTLDKTKQISIVQFDRSVRSS